jgi:mRNA-degrading endonuclease RelE of RelBE toxin-antitoxin system
LGKSSVKAPEAEELSIDLRQYKTRRGRPYRLIFVIKDTKIEVLTLRGSGQNRLKPEER